MADFIEALHLGELPSGYGTCVRVAGKDMHSSTWMERSTRWRIRVSIRDCRRERARRNGPLYFHLKTTAAYEDHKRQLGRPCFFGGRIYFPTAVGKGFYVLQVMPKPAQPGK